MQFKKPKIEKIFEAVSVIADDRIEYTSEHGAHIYSSDKSKFYNLSWSNDFGTFHSDDNSSKWQHTIGYPIVSILIDKGVIDFSTDSYQHLSGINWNDLNKKFKRDYTAAVAHVLREKKLSQDDHDKLIEQVEHAFEQLLALKIEKSTKTL